jgi:leucyl aminopeptidase
VNVDATTAAALETDADTIVIGVFEDEGVAHDLPGNPLDGLLQSGEARRKFKHLAVTHADGKRVILIGLGRRDQFGGERARIAAAIAQRRAAELSARTLCWEVPHHVEEHVIAGLVEGTLLQSYRFDRFKRKPSSESELSLLLLSAHHEIGEPVRRAAALANAQNRARDLANTPANEMTPSDLAAYASGIEGVRVTVLDGQQLRDAGMGAFAAVAQGSAQDPRLIHIEYEGAAGPKLGLIGKAVTFDSGGISIKPAAKMHEMKFDMAGGAAVVEALAALAELHAPVRVAGIVGATENLPSSTAVKPGDIVRALDGTTIEINNTDAEGRLVLADCITYARQQGCERLVDIATLTGGVVTALGSVYAGVMSNDDRLAGLVIESGERTGELVWRLPLHEEYAAMVKGRYADIANTTERREASPIAGGEFLHNFVGDVPWAHLDIAGTAYDAHKPYFGKGASGFGVRLMVDVATQLNGAG